MRILKFLALILVLAVLAGGVLYLMRLEQAENERMTALYAEVEPLERQRESLVKERDSLDAQYALQYRDYATTQILFPKMDTQIYSEVYPLMRERNITGVLGISPVEYPSGWNKLTVEEFKRLLSDGWGMCMVYENSWSDMKYFFDTVEALCEAYEVPVPTTIYFVNNDYDKEMDAILKEHGVRTVVVNASDGRSSTVTDVTAELWFTGALPCGYTGYATDLELLGRTDGANMTYTMVFNETWTDPEKARRGVAQETTQEEIAFTAFLDSWKNYLYYDNPLDQMEQINPATSVFVDEKDKEQLYEIYLKELSPEQQLLLSRFRSTTYEQALDYHMQALRNSDAKRAELEAQQASLDAEIAELNDRISGIYAQWNDLNKR